MKKLFFLLLVVNLVIWLWGQREQLTRLTETKPPALGTILLLSDADVATRRHEALAPAGAPPTAVATAGEEVGGVAPRPAIPAGQGAAPSPTEVARDAGAAVPILDSPAAVPEEPAVVVNDAPMTREEIAVEQREEPAQASIVQAGAEVVADGVDGSRPTPDAPKPVAEATASAEPVTDASPRGPMQTAAAMPDLVRGQPAAPLDPVVAAPMPEATPVETGVVAVVEVIQPAAEVAPPVHPSVPDVALPREPPAGPTDAITGAAGSGGVIAGSSATTPPDAASAAAQPPSPPVAAREVLYLCESIGPFAERPAAVRFQSGLAAPVRGAAVREERSSRPVRHWVLAPVQPSKEATAEYLAKLSQAGVKDAWRIPNGPIAGRLAVGVFQSAENARKHADMLAAKGVAAEVLAPKDLEPIRVYWVDYERPADAAAPDPGNGKGQPARQVVTRSCGRVAGP